MRLRVLSFAGVREVIGASSRTLEVSDGASAGDAWNALALEFPKLREIERSVRLARNGAFVERDVILHDGDELALMPPFGGG
jgi:molybdopterin converting factor small subunit